jgi:G patch domain-containing protein 1
MDEEDLQDLKDSRNLVDATEEMDFLGSTQAELRSKDDETEAEYVLPFSRRLNSSFTFI